jgi:hypothetical protein
MAGDVLLDTSVVIALLKVEPAIVQRLAAATIVHLPVTVIGELCFGAHSRTKLPPICNASTIWWSDQLYCPVTWIPRESMARSSNNYTPKERPSRITTSGLRQLPGNAPCAC